MEMEMEQEVLKLELLELHQRWRKLWELTQLLWHAERDWLGSH